MTAQEQIDGLAREVREIVELVQQHLHAKDADPATVDVDALTAAFAARQQEMIDARVREEIGNRLPVRKGELVGLPGAQVRSLGAVEGGRFDGLSLDDLVFTRALLRQAAKIAPQRVKPPSKELEDVVQKALTATGTGTGDEYVPTGMAAQLWQDVHLASLVVSAFPLVAMPTDPFEIPIGWGDITWRKGTENTTTTVSNPATAKSVLTATEQVGEINWSYSLDEDSIVAVLPTLKAEMTISAAAAMDNFMMNADSTDANTGNINLDDANPPDDAYYLSAGQDGLRHQILVDNTSQSADINTTLTDALLLAALGKMDKYGIISPGATLSPNELVLFCNPKTYLISMLGLANLRTWDKYGPQATILTGEVAKWSGIPVVPTSSIALAEDDGKVSATAGNNDEGTVVIANRRCWRVGFRRELLIEMDRLIRERTHVMVLSFRIAVAARGTRSTATHTAGCHGITYA